MFSLRPFFLSCSSPLLPPPSTMVYCHVLKIVLVFDCADAEAKVNAVTESQAVAVALVIADGAADADVDAVSVADAIQSWYS